MWTRYLLRESILTFDSEWFLTTAAFRLNNRDILRARYSKDNSINDFHISSSFQQNPHKSKSVQTAINFAAMHQTVTAEFARSMSDSDNGLGLDKSVRVLHAVAVLWDWNDCFSAAHNHRLCARSITRASCIGYWLNPGSGVACTKMSEQSMPSFVGPS
jgi:hypothetical protein